MIDAFMVYDAAFDNDFAENNINYVRLYCENIFGLYLSDYNAKAILLARLKWLEHVENQGGIGSTDSFWHIVEKPLKQIKIGIEVRK